MKSRVRVFCTKKAALTLRVHDEHQPPMAAGPSSHPIIYLISSDDEENDFPSQFASSSSAAKGKGRAKDVLRPSGGSRIGDSRFVPFHLSRFQLKWFMSSTFQQAFSLDPQAGQRQIKSHLFTLRRIRPAAARAHSTIITIP